jgi:hypothetical protein
MKSLLNQLISWWNPQDFTGVVIDPRTYEEQMLDYQHNEIALGAMVDWRDKPQEEWNKFPIRAQNGSGSCVAQATVKLLGIENRRETNDFRIFSAYDIYIRRNTKPAAGMWAQDAFSIACNYGATFETLIPSQNMTEAAMNKPVSRTGEMEAIAQTYKAGGYVTISSLDIDDIAQVIAHNKGVLLLVKFTSDEWNDVPVAKSMFPNLYHAVAAVDYTLWKGEKALVIEDSWGKFYGLEGRRVLTKRFLKKRCYYAGYLLDLSNDWNKDATPQTKPKHYFAKTLRFGDRGSEDVKWLQQVLKYEQLFPQAAELTGNYFQITAKAVLAWQKKHKVATDEELNNLGGELIGPKTLSKLNDLYA